jgi:hypothetical protein
MRQPPIRRVAALAVAVSCVALAGAASSLAGAQYATSGSLRMTSDAADWVGQGHEYAFTAPTDTINFGGARPGGFVAFVTSANGDSRWQLTLRPPAGQSLVPGVYSDAQRFSDAAHPGIDISGDGRGCNATTGSFRILDARFASYGYLEYIHATFEQHCEGATDALRGEIEAVAPPPPPPVEIRVTVDAQATVDRSDGKVTLRGTVSCSTPVVAYVDAALTQQQKKGQASAASDVVYMPNCSPAPQRWQAILSSSSAIRFASGTAQVTADGRAPDEWYSAYNDYHPWIYATDEVQAAVDLKAGT